MFLPSGENFTSDTRCAATQLLACVIPRPLGLRPPDEPGKAVAPSFCVAQAASESLPRSTDRSAERHADSRSGKKLSPPALEKQ
jgi:hypothetical protein